MNETPITYETLFALLTSLGFEQRTPGRPSEREPVGFVHQPTQTVLLYRGPANGPVSPTDLLSTEVHLRARSIIHEPLELLIAETAAK